jgi:AcrR family transcriptional regulator
MATSELAQAAPQKPMRADARRNYEKVLEAAATAFGERGASTSLEDIARRAGVGIGTLYRHFPTRQALLEAVYVDEVQRICDAAGDLDALPPWEALSTWLKGVVGYLATKQALANELFEFIGRDSELFLSCRQGIFEAGQPLLDRAQQSGAVRSDVTLSQVIQMVGGIAKMQNVDPEQVQHVLSIALDGLRYRPQ